MRKLYFLLPGTKGKFGGGGLWAELKTIELAQKICDTQMVTYRQKEPEHLFLDELLPSVDRDRCIFVVNWGFDVPKLLSRLKNYHVIYHAHSAGYGFALPSDVPIIAVSRNTMGYWGEQSANSLIYYLPNQLGTEFYDAQKLRDIDVLVQVRKSSQYLIQHLVPALQPICKVKVIDSYVEDLAALFNRSKIYLYDSAEYWKINNVTEGFGLPPLEALACGCNIFSSVNNALADYLDPGFNCYKIGCYGLEYDIKRILTVINNNQKPNLSQFFWQEYKAENIINKLQVILTDINGFFDCKTEVKSPIPSFSFSSIKRLQLAKLITKIKNKL